MKLYSKQEFIKLQTPIIFSYLDVSYQNQGLYECFEFIKDDNDEVIDYGVVNLLDDGKMVSTEGFKEWSNWEYDRDYIDSGKEFYLDLACGQRDGRYSDNEQFIVYDRADIKNLICALQNIYIERYDM